MSLDFDPIYLVWLTIGASAALTAEAVYHRLPFRDATIAAKSTAG